MALLITSNQPESLVSAQDPRAGFTANELSRIIDAHAKAFRLRNGSVLLVDSLLSGASVEEMNITATCLLRNALDAPEADVCGSALLLGPDEAELLSPPVQAALLLNGSQPIRTVLLLDRDEGVRPTMALGLEIHHYRVIQARTALDVVDFCRKHTVDFVLADVSSLEPHALETLRYFREFQPQADVLVISGYDRVHIEQWHPNLLNGAGFLQKPFTSAVLDAIFRQMRRTSDTRNKITPGKVIQFGTK